MINNALNDPALNKSSAFSESERKSLGLLGLLPFQTETQEQQIKRCHLQYQQQATDLDKCLFLNELHDISFDLFHALVRQHMTEMLPMIYTPTIAQAVTDFSREFRRPHGLFLNYPQKDQMDDMFANCPQKEIDMIIVTDGEGVLGIGDQGVGSMCICQGKAQVYTVCANLDPARILKIQLDVGTNNETLLNDPLYLGWKHERIVGKEYNDFIDQFVEAVFKYYPDVLLHWEDFSTSKAHDILERYREKILTFNDDIQGTGVITLGCLLAAVHAQNQSIADQRVIILGAGAAGVGIADQITSAMVQEGLSLDEARDRIYLAGRKGLIAEGLVEIREMQRRFAKPENTNTKWLDSSLLEMVRQIKPTILIGSSTATGAFTEEIVKAMSEHVEHPIIFPLSNPTSKAEAKPEDLVRWTNGKALIATGSPFDPVEYNNTTYTIAQCNNAYAFPGIGLGIIESKTTRVTDNMLMAAALAIAECSPAKKDLSQSLLPPLTEVQAVSRKVADAVKRQAVEEKDRSS